MKNYFELRAGKEGEGLTLQDKEVIALRKVVGNIGTLNDLRREFYRRLTGDSWVSDAKAKVKKFESLTETINFVGKSKNDGDLTRRIYFQALGTNPPTNVSYKTLESDTFEVGGGYAGVSKKDEGTTMFYSTTSRTRVYFLFVFDLAKYGTKDELKVNLKSLKFNIKTNDAIVLTTYGEGSQLIHEINGTGDESIELIGVLNDILESESSTKIRILVANKEIGDGLTAKRLDIDYVELVPTFFTNPQ